MMFNSNRVGVGEKTLMARMKKCDHSLIVFNFDLI